jgi:uncharacterized protein YdhG (YjbR/CyaY superfamily)
MYRAGSSPDAYRNDVSGRQRQILEAIRDLIFEIAPDAEEVIQYGMLAYPGVANLAAQKHDVALDVNPAVLAKHRGQLPGVDCGKSCLRFRSTKQIDPEALRDLVRDVIAARSE